MNALRSGSAIGLFTLTMINVAAVGGGARSWPITAIFGMTSLIYIVLASIVFFIPASMVVAELTSGWPKAGGVYLWVKEAFGHRTGFLAIWLQWIEIVVWYPTILSFIAASVAYVVDPSLVKNSFFMITVILIIFWGSTYINLKGMRASAMISKVGVLIGTFIPAGIVVVVLCIWLYKGEPIHLPPMTKDVLPNLNNLDQLGLFTGIILSLAGMEMSAVHMQDVNQPRKNYPRAILYSALIILIFTIIGVLSIAIMFPRGHIIPPVAPMQAFPSFASPSSLKCSTALMAALNGFGAFAALHTWIAGPTRGILKVADTGDFPPLFRSVTKKGMPIAVLIFQAIVVSFLSSVFIFMPTITSSYWLMSILAAELYIIMYFLMFAAAIKLKHAQPHIKRSFNVPGGKIGMWCVAGLGILSSLFAMIVGFIPTSLIPKGSGLTYITFLTIGIIFFSLGPTIILLFQKPSWKRHLTK